MHGAQDRRQDPRTVFALLWAAFFLHGMTAGFWVPALTNILSAQGLQGWVPLIFMVPPLCTLVTPLVGGAMVDQRYAADRLYAWSSLGCAVALALAFTALGAGWSPWWFIGLLALHSLLGAPSWGILAMISLTHLSHGARQFPLVRVGATIGWIAGGLATSHLLHADSSPLAGHAAALVRLACGLLAFLLPHTPPLGGRPSSLKSRLGPDAFALLKQRDHCVFFVVTALFSIPLAAFYMYAPEFLKVLGNAHPTGTMGVAQVLEIAAMLLVGTAMTRFRVKTVLLWALGLSALRYAMSAHAGAVGSIGWHISGIALHGVCYTFYFITAQVFLDRRVDPAMKGQAQGLLAMVSGGLGPLLGSLVCGWMRGRFATDDTAGWMWFWLLLAAMIAGCFAVFAAFYRGQGKRRVP